MALQTETEEKIIASAERLFYQKGKAGCSMQDIADDAGINRTLLNYYFRSKDQLFEAVFRKALGTFVPSLASMMRSDIPIREYVPAMAEKVIDTMIENPQIPIFVLQELSSNPDRMPQIIREMGINPALAMKKMAAEGNLPAGQGTDPRQFIINLISLCIFPFAARPVITDILFEGDNEAFLKAMQERKALVPAMVNLFMNQNPKP
jgi:TetR/AcrR family transcriptional regulator